MAVIRMLDNFSEYYIYQRKTEFYFLKGMIHTYPLIQSYFDKSSIQLLKGQPILTSSSTNCASHRRCPSPISKTDTRIFTHAKVNILICSQYSKLCTVFCLVTLKSTHILPRFAAEYSKCGCSYSHLRKALMSQMFVYILFRIENNVGVKI